MAVPLTAKQTTDPRAAASMKLALKCMISARTAAIAKTTPTALSQSGARTRVLSSALRSLRRRSWSRSAAIPMVATTTRASGLVNADRLV